MAKGYNASSRDLRQTRDANQIQFQADIAEGSRVATGCEWCKASLPSHSEFSTQVRSEDRARIGSRSFQGGELPHARAQRALAVQLAHKQSASARIEQHGRGESDLDRWASLASGRQLFGDAELARAAPIFGRAFLA